jgi:hypothetical protein
LIERAIRIETGANARRHALDRPLALDRVDTSSEYSGKTTIYKILRQLLPAEEVTNLPIARPRRFAALDLANGALMHG